jgi:drug/metabolite transporter (DMT)-like permease
MKRSTLGLLLLQTVFVLSWSSGFIGAKLAARSDGVFNVLFWRFLLVSVCLALFLNVRLLKVSRARIRHHAVVGFLSQFLYLTVTLVWAALMFGDVIYASTYIGIAVVVAGLILVRLKQPAAACTS